MEELQLDARKWRFLDNAAGYTQGQDLKIETLERQFKTAKEILSRLKKGSGVLLADDVGLGKTTVGALVTWALASQGKRVRIYAPNKLLCGRWAKELQRHVRLMRHLDVRSDCVKQVLSKPRPGIRTRLNNGCIQITTHHLMSVIPGDCDLAIIDEAHRAKGEDSSLGLALQRLDKRAQRKLILTATPFSIKVAELERLLQFVGATEITAAGLYASELKRLYALGAGHDLATEATRLIVAAKGAITALHPYLIRHGIDDLSEFEKKHFGAVDNVPWNIETKPASASDIELLLRIDRILQLSPERLAARRNDPRFHIGWQHLALEVNRAEARAAEVADKVVLMHIEAAKKSLSARIGKAHPKIKAVSDAILPVLHAGEKVLVFCHHRATANELLSVLERSLKIPTPSEARTPEPVWRKVWKASLADDPLVQPIIDWLCTPGIRRQIEGWIGTPATSETALIAQISQTKPRNGGSGVPSILEAAQSLVKNLLDKETLSTRALLRNIKKQTSAFGGEISHFPGRLNEGFRVMGSWDHTDHESAPKTLYMAKPDIVLALFNSPFGPDVLVTTDRLSEGVDLHRWCRHLIHYELDPSPVRTLQRNGRIRRVGSWAALTRRPILYSYPTFDGTRDEKAARVMTQRIKAFGLLLGGVPTLDDAVDESEQTFAELVLGVVGNALGKLNRKLHI